MEKAAVRFISGSTDSGKRSNMQTDNRFLDDLAKVASGALGSVSGVKHEVEVRIQQQLERLLARMNLVPREEFDAMKAVAQAAREAQIKLESRVAALESRLAAEDAIAAGNLADAPEASAAQDSESERP
ncbi:MAG TPA: accessory factor UbiK family protein [Dongiaceae bacterium]|nr:accessory factor UbiK family protein [Dongiaceae bacterium]